MRQVAPGENSIHEKLPCGCCYLDILMRIVILMFWRYFGILALNQEISKKRWKDGKDTTENKLGSPPQQNENTNILT